MAKSKLTVEQIDERITRWQGKLKRAVNTIERLQRMRKRELAKAAKPKPEPLAVRLLKQMAAEGAAESAEKPVAPSVQPPAEIDTAIPAFLKRGNDTPEAEQIRTKQAELKRRKAAGRIAKMKAKQSGETRKMPLTGKAALAAIRG